jgi:uncharacterized protein (UPF0147 family)
MAGNAPDNLQPKQEEALIALLNHPTIKKAAEAIGVSERTVHRWLDDPAFSKAFRTARRQAFTHAMSMTQQYAPAAVATLTKVATDATAPHAARASAATALLKFSRESIELDELAERVEAIEQQVQASQAPALARGAA